MCPTNVSDEDDDESKAFAQMTSSFGFHPSGLDVSYEKRINKPLVGQVIQNQKQLDKGMQTQSANNMSIANQAQLIQQRP